MAMAGMSPVSFRLPLSVQDKCANEHQEKCVSASQVSQKAQHVLSKSSVITMHASLHETSAFKGDERCTNLDTHYAIH